MTNLTHKEIEEFEKYFAGVEALRGLHSSYKGKGLFLIYLSQKKAEWQNEVIEAIPNEVDGDSEVDILKVKQNLKSQFKGKE